MWDFRSTFQSPSPCCVGADGHGFLNPQVWKPVHGKLSFTFIQGERKVPLHVSEVGYGLELKVRWRKCWKWHPSVCKQALHTCQLRCFYVWDLSHFQHTTSCTGTQGLTLILQHVHCSHHYCALVSWSTGSVNLTHGVFVSWLSVLNSRM